MKRSMFALFFFFACTEPSKTEPIVEPVRTVDSTQKTAEIYSSIKTTMDTTIRFVETFQKLEGWPFNVPDDEKCPLKTPALRGTLAQGTSFATLPSSNTGLDLKDSTFERAYELYAPCSPFSKRVLRALAHTYSEQNSRFSSPLGSGLFILNAKECHKYIKDYWSFETCNDLGANSGLQVAAEAAKLRLLATILQDYGDLGALEPGLLLTLVGAFHSSSLTIFMDVAIRKPTTPEKVCNALFQAEWMQARITPSKEAQNDAKLMCSASAETISALMSRRP